MEKFLWVYQVLWPPPPLRAPKNQRGCQPTFNNLRKLFMSDLTFSSIRHTRPNDNLNRFPHQFVFVRSTHLPIRAISGRSFALPVRVRDDCFDAIPQKKGILDYDRALNVCMGIVESFEHHYSGDW